MIRLTENAVNQVRKLMNDNGLVDGFGLRVGIEPGGCSGYSYLLDIDEPEEDDEVFAQDDVQIFVDPKSHLLLDGLEIDWDTSMMGGGFKFSNPNARKSCGCGTSFMVA